MQFNTRTMVQPDLFVFSEDAEFDRTGPIPVAAAKLAIEVSSTTSRHDLGPKLRAYASAGLAEYWVILLQAEPKVLLRHTHPAGGGYASVETFEPGEDLENLDDVVSTLAAGSASE